MASAALCVLTRCCRGCKGCQHFLAGRVHVAVYSSRFTAPLPPCSHAWLAKGVEGDRGERVLLRGPRRAQRGQRSTQRVADAQHPGGAQALQE